jgi:hypothetical protein
MGKLDATTDPALPRATENFRRRSWFAFQIALDRHLLGRGHGVEPGKSFVSAEELDRFEEARRDFRPGHGHANWLKRLTRLQP